MDDGDTTMGEDRFQSLEDRIQALEISQIEQQKIQSQQHSEVAGQISAIHSKVDAQAATLQQHLDHKMDEQLAHIERLLLRGQGEHDPKKVRHE